MFEDLAIVERCAFWRAYVELEKVRAEHALVRALIRLGVNDEHRPLGAIKKDLDNLEHDCNLKYEAMMSKLRSS